MKRAEILAAFEGLDQNAVSGSPKNIEITRRYLEGASASDIARKFNLSNNRINQIVSKQARKANATKMIINDPKYKELVQKYLCMMKNGEEISFQSDCENLELHMAAADAADATLYGGEKK